MILQEECLAVWLLLFFLLLTPVISTRKKSDYCYTGIVKNITRGDQKLNQVNKWTQHVLLAFLAACSMTALFSPISYSGIKIDIFHIPLIFLILFCLLLNIVEEIRANFKKHLSLIAHRKDTY